MEAQRLLLDKAKDKIFAGQNDQYLKHGDLENRKYLRIFNAVKDGTVPDKPQASRQTRKRPPRHNRESQQNSNRPTNRRNRNRRQEFKKEPETKKSGARKSESSQIKKQVVNTMYTKPESIAKTGVVMSKTGKERPATWKLDKSDFEHLVRASQLQQ